MQRTLNEKQTTLRHLHALEQDDQKNWLVDKPRELVQHNEAYSLPPKLVETLDVQWM